MAAASAAKAIINNGISLAIIVGSIMCYFRFFRFLLNSPRWYFLRSFLRKAADLPFRLGIVKDERRFVGERSSDGCVQVNYLALTTRNGQRDKPSRFDLGET